MAVYNGQPRYQQQQQHWTVLCRQKIWAIKGVCSVCNSCAIKPPINLGYKSTGGLLLSTFAVTIYYCYLAPKWAIVHLLFLYAEDDGILVTWVEWLLITCSRDQNSKWICREKHWLQSAANVRSEPALCNADSASCWRCVYLSIFIYFVNCISCAD